MGRGGHGANMTGGNHSHDPDYPEDIWNLYQHLDLDLTKGFNLVGIDSEYYDISKIFRPYVNRLGTEGSVKSDVDGDILIAIHFKNPVFLKAICVIGHGDSSSHPSKVKCYANKYLECFSQVESTNSSLTLELETNPTGEITYNTNLDFSYITSLSLYFNQNHGEGEITSLAYIGLKGEHTHDKREVINGDYSLVSQNRDKIDTPLTNKLDLLG